MSDQIPDFMVDLRAWLRSLNVVGTRVFFRLPENPSQSPFARLSRTGGGPLVDAEVPLADPQVTIEVWGMMDSDAQAVRQAALGFENAIHAVNGPTPAGTGTTILWANVLNTHDSPDPDTGWPRQIILAQFGVKASA